MHKDQTKIDKPPRRPLKDSSGRATDNPKLPKQADGPGSQPSGANKARARDALKH
jgi:hypothetical protein